MANMYQNSFAYKPTRRYTIPHLLQLAHDRLSFDLSKFSYDAARAGVVPPLGDCAMSSRRSSNNRRRGWSSASFETNEDIVVFGGNINSVNIVKPDRQPINPPAAARAEKDVGFARFLKKHSSPTHNRVTAGGRIVPMEKRYSPPKFSLPMSAQPNPEVDAYIKREWGSSPHVVGAANNQEPATLYQSGGLAPARNIRQDSIGVHAPESGPEPKISPQASSSGQITHQSINDTGVVVHSVQENHLNPYVAQMQSQSGYSYFTSSMPYFPMQPAMPYAGYAWPATEMYNLALMKAIPNFHSDPHMQMTWSNWQILNDAEALFSNLDRQLKLIDRHRAMNNHDPKLSAQRMAIVQQRADAKETVKRLKMQFGMDQSQLQSPGRMPFAATMTPVFVPTPMAPVQQTAAASPNFSDGLTRISMMGEKPQTTTKRKPIPIVPPPAVSSTQVEPYKKNDVLAIKKSAVKPEDSKNNIQSERAQPCYEPAIGASSFSKTSTMLQDNATPAKPKAESTEDQDDESPKGLLHQEWMKINEGPAETAEGIYELQLDAMRLPEGATVLIELPNGSEVTVPGCKLGRPSLSLMSDFEKDYWDRKPVYTMEMLQNLRKNAKIQDGKTTLTDDYLVANADGPLASPAKEVESDSKHDERAEKYIEDQTKCLGDYATLRHVSVKNALSVAYEIPGHGTAGTAGAPITNATQGRQADDGVRIDSDSMAFDEMSHKGYSSVSIQNINVQVQLPLPGFDGATDPNRRSAAVSSLTAAGKHRSGRLLHRSTPNGGA